MHIGAAMFFTDYSMSPGELGKALEERGFESVWAPEHSHIPLTRKSPFPGGGELPKKYYDAMDPFVSLMAAAAATKNLKVGTGVCLVNQRDPIQTAKLVSTIDQLSGGRFLFGVGNGWNQDEMENHGTDFDTRHKLVRERIEAMKAIWTKSKAEYHGELVKFDPMMAWPKPAQKPHPPILVGGAFPYGARRALALRRRLDAAAFAQRLCRGEGPVSEVSRDGEGSQPRSRHRADLHLERQGRRGPAEARSRRRRGAGHHQPRIRPRPTPSCPSSTAGRSW